MSGRGYGAAVNHPSLALSSLDSITAKDPRPGDPSGLLLPARLRVARSCFPTHRGPQAVEKPSFRRLVGRRHGVVAFSGFYEWKKDEKGEKQPFYLHYDDDRPMLVSSRCVRSF